MAADEEEHLANEQLDEPDVADEKAMMISTSTLEEPVSKPTTRVVRFGASQPSVAPALLRLWRSCTIHCRKILLPSSVFHFRCLRPRCYWPVLSSSSPESSLRCALYHHLGFALLGAAQR